MSDMRGSEDCRYCVCVWLLDVGTGRVCGERMRTVLEHRSNALLLGGGDA